MIAKFEERIVDYLFKVLGRDYGIPEEFKKVVLTYSPEKEVLYFRAWNMRKPMYRMSLEQEAFYMFAEEDIDEVCSKYNFEYEIEDDKIIIRVS